jgi:hypothetical protein
VEGSFLLYDENVSLSCCASSIEAKSKFVAAFESQKEVFDERKRKENVRSFSVGSKEEVKSPPTGVFKGKISLSFLTLKNN